MQVLVWKRQTFTLTRKIIRQFYFLLISSVKAFVFMKGDMEEFRNTDKSYGTLLKMYGPWVAAHFWNPYIMADLLWA